MTRKRKSVHIQYRFNIFFKYFHAYLEGPTDTEPADAKAQCPYIIPNVSTLSSLSHHCCDTQTPIHSLEAASSRSSHPYSHQAERLGWCLQDDFLYHEAWSTGLALQRKCKHIENAGYYPGLWYTVMQRRSAFLKYQERPGCHERDKKGWFSKVQLVPLSSQTV